MNDRDITYRLGLEELAMGVSLAGNPESARGMLLANLGNLNADEERGRLLAANHSLLAKGLIVLEKNTPKLHPDFENVIKVITQYDFSLRLSYGSGVSEKILAYYYYGKKVMKHENLQGVSHHLSWVTNPEQIIQDGTRFFGFLECKDFMCPEAEVRQVVLDEAKGIAVTQPQTVLEYLKDVGVPEKTAKLLGDDLACPDFRGSALRIERKDGGMVSDRGILVMVRKPRSWMFPIFLKNDEPYARILARTETSFKKEILALVS